MTDFSKPTVADMVIGGADHNIGTSGTLHDIDWGTEDGYWQENHARQPYAKADQSYDAYRPAYKYGYAASRRLRRPWDDAVEADLARGWPAARAECRAEWPDVRDAVRAAYSRAAR
jgi:hypothetical protein